MCIRDRLGCFDYVVQPAPYQEIEDALLRAIAKVHTGDEPVPVGDYRLDQIVHRESNDDGSLAFKGVLDDKLYLVDFSKEKAGLVHA